ncbi:MAG: hypothetical protein IPJ48_10360 [Propionivibrio sp.]|uniref:C2H2-type domain-containing protein n=1 Tax=Candidatus Propionivibrio dominans TaxID=2954373 RepID=A0A9D7FBM6_9RHOO|nr:hypothetical protein [Candidatus Propionivibrio dominans]
MVREKQPRCIHCGQGFTPDERNVRHQRYCGAAPCKAASKKASQTKWLAKPENKDYHNGPEALARVRAWRAAHPGYSRRKPGSSDVSVQDDLPFEPSPSRPTLVEVMASAKISCIASEATARPPLQDFLNAQPIVLVGLIAHIWGSALQEAMPYSA